MDKPTEPPSGISLSGMMDAFGADGWKWFNELLGYLDDRDALAAEVYRKCGGKE